MGMGDGFNDRVDKVFGSISPWSLTDAQLERSQWNHRQRDYDDQIPLFSSFFNHHHVRSSIGLDSTLDHEEEEDSYDKMAQGREDCGDRLYMKTHHALPRSLTRDAAKTQEDDNDVQAEQASQDGVIKSILKRKAYDEAPKPAKRVRFDSTCKDAARPTTEDFGPTQVSGNGPSVPDYILNPSNYTRYSFDNSSHDGSNLGLLEQIKKSSTYVGVEQKLCGELPKSVLFIPRKKRGDDAGCNSEEQVKPAASSPTVGIAIAAGEGEFQEDDDDDDVCSTKARRQKPVRQYRSKMEESDDDDDDVS